VIVALIAGTSRKNKNKCRHEANGMLLVMNVPNEPFHYEIHKNIIAILEKTITQNNYNCL
jgi:hypothetical protein